MRHIFDNPKHGLDNLVERVGGRDRLVRAVVRALGDDLKQGEFKTYRMIDGNSVRITGWVSPDGRVYLSNFWRG